MRQLMGWMRFPGGWRWLALVVMATFGLQPSGSARAGEMKLADVRSWAYQLQNVDPLQIKSSPYDLLVIDYGFAKHQAATFPREIIDLMRRKPDGSRRFIFAYLSIGEAEDYRYYWQDSWTREHPPQWLDPENPDWPGNFMVRYWDADWQSLLFGNRNAYLDRILDAGFDGVYLDGVDAFERWGKRRESAASEMVDLVERISSYARARQKDFLVIAQNGDRLLSDPRFRAAIDGFAREDLLYSESREGNRNPRSSIIESVVRLNLMAQVHKPVLVVEYPRDPALGSSLAEEINSLGFLPYLTRRDLNSLAAAPLDPSPLDQQAPSQ
jgi:cysteinyl-tRNA synthetase, unknown class